MVYDVAARLQLRVARAASGLRSQLTYYRYCFASWTGFLSRRATNFAAELLLRVGTRLLVACSCS